MQIYSVILKFLTGTAFGALPRDIGLGLRPDGGPVTASVGIAEHITDAAGNWQELVDIADQRMYSAKLAGKDRCVGCGQGAAEQKVVANG